MNYSVLAGELYTPVRRMENALIQVEDDRVVSIYPMQANVRPTYDFSDAIVIPGLVDLQVNGASGYSFQAHHHDHFDEVLSFHRSNGTTTLLPTLITAPSQLLIDSLQVLSAYISRSKMDIMPGIHLEGPFLSPEKSGAHDPSALCLPDSRLAFKYYQAAEEKIRILTLAPELPGALDVIRALHQWGVISAAGHTAATYDQMIIAVEAGLKLVTHMGNACDWPHRKMGTAGFLASEPGVVGSFLAIDQLSGSLIMDGYHFHPALLMPMLRLKGPDKLYLVSDASTVAGCPPGEYESGGLKVVVNPQGVALSGLGGGWLAGSTITLLNAMQYAVKIAGISIQHAVHMASLGPARRLGISNIIGHLEPGALANMVILNKDLSKRSVFFNTNTGIE